MDLVRARESLPRIQPITIEQRLFVRAYNTRVLTHLDRTNFFDSRWSYERGYRYNFKATHPVFYLAEDSIVASSEIGPRTRRDFLAPMLHAEADPYLYVQVRVSAKLLDVTDDQVRDLLAVTVDEVMVPTERWDEDMSRGVWAATHHLGRLALGDRRFGGILYPSYPSQRLLDLPGDCVAIFMDSRDEEMSKPLRDSVRLEVIDPGGVLQRLGLRF